MAFIERLIFPTLEKCKRLQEEKKILAGGPQSGAVALFSSSVESARELDRSHYLAVKTKRRFR